MSHCPIRLLRLMRSDEAPSSFLGLMMLLGLDSAGEPNWGGSSLGGALGFLSALGLIDWASWGASHRGARLCQTANSPTPALHEL